MRAILSTCLVFGLLTGAAVRAADQPTPQAVIDKAIKAHGGVEKLTKHTASQTKTKGTLEALNGITFTSETTVQFPDKLKDVMEMQVMGQNVTLVTVYNGKQASITANGQAVPLPDKALDEVKEAVSMLGVMRMVGLTKKGYELAPLGEAKVNDRPAVGVRVTRKNARDLNLYFDKETGLVVKVERRGVDPMSGQEFTEERVITEYQEKDGMKYAKKVVIHRDGKKYLEAEVLETKFLDKVDDSEFKQP